MIGTGECSLQCCSLLLNSCRSHEVELYELKQQPVVLNYDEFETAVLVLAYHRYNIEKHTESSFEEFLGEVCCLHMLLARTQQHSDLSAHEFEWPGSMLAIYK